MRCPAKGSNAGSGITVERGEADTGGHIENRDKGAGEEWETGKTSESGKRGSPSKGRSDWNLLTTHYSLLATFNAPTRCSLLSTLTRTTGAFTHGQGLQSVGMDFDQGDLSEERPDLRPTELNDLFQFSAAEVPDPDPYYLGRRPFQ